MNNTVLVIDFNNVAFSSYYNKPLYNSRDMNVNAIRIFFYKIKYFKDIFNPDKIVFATDMSRERTFRKKLFKPYKAQRTQKNDDIINQIKYIRQLISLLGYPMLSNELYEADDIIGMISRMNDSMDINTVAISSDKDLYQLITKRTVVMSPRENDIIDENYMMEKYRLTPSQWIELKILQGDKSDNIPGVHGIGEITALKLIQQYGTVDNVYQNINKLPAKLKNILLRGQEFIDLTRTLVTIVTDYNSIGLDQSKLNRSDVYLDDALDVLNQLEISSLINIFKYSF